MSRFQQARSAVLTRDETQRLVERALSFSRADECDVNIGSGVAGNTRFAANQLSTSGVVEDANVAVQSHFGPKHAVVTTNDLSEESLRRVVRQSETLARMAPDDPESMPALPPQQYQEVDAWVEGSASITPEVRARAALSALQEARRSGDLQAAGFIITAAGSGCVANKRGLFAYHRNTSCNYSLTVRTSDGTGSGWAAADDQSWARLDVQGVSRRAVEKARLSRNPVAIEPGRYTVVLEPQAVADLVQLMAGYLDARRADEGRSPFVKPEGGNRIGERIIDPRVTIFSDPGDPQLLGQPFDGQGLPLGRQVWVENGVLRQMFYSRFWAQRQNRTATGGPTTLKFAGGDSTLERMVASTERGVLLTRLFYLREVDPRTIMYTGLTRDGTFLIENRRVSRSIRNFRFNESPLQMLNNLEAIGEPVRIGGGGDIVMPALKVRDFNFTSLSDAV